MGILPRAKQQPAGLIACGLRAAALFSSAPSLPQKKGTSLSRCLLLAEMVGFEPTCPIKDKTISSRSRYDRFDTSPYDSLYSIAKKAFSVNRFLPYGAQKKGGRTLRTKIRPIFWGIWSLLFVRCSRTLVPSKSEPGQVTFALAGGRRGRMWKRRIL